MFQVVELRVAVQGDRGVIREMLDHHGKEIARRVDSILMSEGFTPIRLLGGNTLVPRIRDKQPQEEPEQISLGLRGDLP